MECKDKETRNIEALIMAVFINIFINKQKCDDLIKSY